MAEKIKTVDGQTLLNMDLPPIQFIVEGLLPQGLHIFAGAAKTGKSWLLLLLSLKISKGEPFWNQRTSQGAVVYSSNDDIAILNQDDNMLKAHKPFCGLSLPRILH